MTSKKRGEKFLELAKEAGPLPASVMAVSKPSPEIQERIVSRIYELVRDERKDYA